MAVRCAWRRILAGVANNRRMRVLIVDDHPIMRLAVRHLVVGAWPDATIDEAETLADALARCKAAAPSVVLLDLQLPDAVGIEGVARLMRVAHDAPIVVLSGSPESAYAARLLQMGVRGFVPKDRAASDLVLALRRVLDGGRYITDAAAEHLLGLLDGSQSGALPHEQLSAQEFRVMQQIAAGRTPAQIAEAMHLSVKTVGSYRARILAKTGWQSTAELVRYCTQHGLTDD